ncbi:hypothetical protein NIES22_42380 [Calothrix brevissima NIES-22]|nr:hypothetical protein NIES22_42380 [Calothrix brevissima NIES-22]
MNFTSFVIYVYLLYQSSIIVGHWALGMGKRDFYVFWCMWFIRATESLETATHGERLQITK